VRIGAAAKLNGLSYSVFINGLKKAASIWIARFSPILAVNDAAGFATLCKQAQAAVA